MAVDMIARMMALDAAQGGTGDAYTKAETDELLADKPGEITTGKQYTIDGQTVTAGTGADAFNDLTNNKAAGPFSHAEGNSTTASGAVSHAEGNSTVAAGVISHAEGQNTIASGQSSHAEGAGTNASGDKSHAEGGMTTASGAQSHAEGNVTTASGPCSHAEGQGTKASSQHQHVQGKFNVEDSLSRFAFIIGNGTADNARSNAFTVQWDGSVAEGNHTITSAPVSHAEGQYTTASGQSSHAEGSSTIASGTNSHAEGDNTKASSANQHVQGKYNVEDSNSKYAFIIGNGTADNARHNAFAIDWNGLIYVNGAATGVNVATLAADLAALTARVEALENQ